MHTEVPQIVAATRGEAKHGKTSFIMSFLKAGKVWLVDADRGYQDIAFKFDRENVIWKPIGSKVSEPGDWEKLLDPKLHDGTLKEFVRTYVEGLCAMRDVGGGTVGVDTGTQLWQDVDSWKLEEVRGRRQEAENVRADNRNKQAKTVEPSRLDYSEANKLMGDIIRTAYDFPTVNVIFTHRNSAIYDSEGHETTQTKLQGWKEMPAAVSVMLNLVRTGEKAAMKFTGTFEACRVNPKLVGVSFPNPSYEALKEWLSDE